MSYKNINNLGFIVEVCLFVAAGYFLRLNYTIALILFLIGLALAITVGYWIEQEAIRTYREEYKC